MKNIVQTLLLAALIGMSAPFAAHAQEINFGALNEAQPNRVQLRAGAEYGLVLGLGYARSVPFFDRMLVLQGDVTLPSAEMDVNDYRLRAGFMLPIVGPDRWKLNGGMAGSVRGTENDIARMTSIGLDFALVGGYYAPHWFAAGELGFDWALTTHVDNSAAYRSTVYADAKDGWYASPGGNLRAGLQGGVSFGRYDVILRAGMLRDVAGEEPMLPFYGTLGFAMRW
jgi:hypothetical protein